MISSLSPVYSCPSATQFSCSWSVVIGRTVTRCGWACSVSSRGNLSCPTFTWAVFRSLLIFAWFTAVVSSRNTACVIGKNFGLAFGPVIALFRAITKVVGRGIAWACPALGQCSDVGCYLGLRGCFISLCTFSAMFLGFIRLIRSFTNIFAVLCIS